MALDNLIGLTLSESDLSILDQALSSIENVLSGKTINLTPDQRQKKKTFPLDQ